MDSRAEFESEWSKRFSDHKLARMQTMGGDLHDEYRDSRVNYAWIMWQASRQGVGGQDARLINLLADIRFACGDDGKRMQGELVEYIGELARKAGELEGEPVGEIRRFGFGNLRCTTRFLVSQADLAHGTKLYTHPASESKGRIDGDKSGYGRIADSSGDKQAVSVPDGLLNHIVSMIDLHEKRGVVLAVHMQELAEHIGYEPKQEGE